MNTPDFGVRVECYAGHRGEQEPRRFWLGERQITVTEILDRWISPDHRYFKVRGDDAGRPLGTHLVRKPAGLIRSFCTSMLPIHKLLSRIRWDPRFRRGQFALGYFDRIARRIVVVPFDTVRFPSAAPDMFEIWDDEGILHRIPLHRVRRVYRDGRLIWERRPPNELPGQG